MGVRFTRQADDDIIDSYLYGFLNFGREQADHILIVRVLRDEADLTRHL